MRKRPAPFSFGRRRVYSARFFTYRQVFVARSSSAVPRLAFVASDAPKAQEALVELKAAYKHVEPDKADVIVALGGDGFMLQTLHRHMGDGVPVYGMNQGTVGFLMNQYAEDGLLARIKAAVLTPLNPLSMKAKTQSGRDMESLAINEVSLLRQTRQAGKIRISIDGKVRLEELTCDGVLLSTTAGSTAYNLSAHGPILPLDAGVLALTPISAFRPRRWRGALLPRKAHVRLEILEALKRPISAVADNTEVRDVIDVSIAENRRIKLNVLFDPEHSLEERILTEQFIP
jgi:NAD+ kinase